MPRLTNQLVKSLQPREKVWQCWDSQIRGLWLKIQPTGYKSFGYDYRFPPGRKGRKRHHVLGPWPTLTLDDARRLAQHYLMLIRHQGIDPLATAQAQRSLPTVAQLAERYLAEHARPHKKARSVAEDERNLRLHILPALGERQVATITRQDIARLHHGMHATPVAANRVLALLSTMFALAEAWELREAYTNPVHGIQRYKERKVERFLSGDELQRLGEALATADEERVIAPAALACIRLLLYTGARLREITGLQWQMLDLERGIARLPESKTGSKTIRLPTPALAILRAIPRQDGTLYVFPSRHGTPLSIHRAWRTLCAQAGIVGARVHDLRHTYASWGAMDGLTLPMIGALLGHSSPAMSSRYAHLTGNPVALASEQIAARVRQAMGEG